MDGAGGTHLIGQTDCPIRESREIKILYQNCWIGYSVHPFASVCFRLQLRSQRILAQKI